jgi:acetyl esterase/lipase
MLLSFLMATGAAVRARITRNIAYGLDPGARLDVYAPIGADGEAPVIVFAHGGRMSGGARGRFRCIGVALASRGFVTIIVDFRLDAEPGVEQELADLACAAAWTRVNAGRFGGDATRVFLLGHANGARCVAKLCLESRWLESHGIRSGDLRGAIGVSGLYEGLAAGDAAPPMLLIAGQNDSVDPEITSGLARALRTTGGQVAEIRYPKMGDRGGLQRLASVFRMRMLVLGEVERFVRQHSLGSGA